MGKVVLDKVAYEAHPVSMDRKRELNAKGFKIIDARFKPDGSDLADDGLRIDGPTVEQYAGLCSRSTPEEIAAAVTAQAGSGKIELGTDSGDQISEEELRKIIAQETGKAPHPAAKYETLVARYNELNAKAAAGE